MRVKFMDVRDLMFTDSATYERAMAAGRLDVTHTVLELPDGFDFGANTIKPLMGLGDRIASIAQPIARVIDSALGTDIEHCGGCAKRKEFLNNL